MNWRNYLHSAVTLFTAMLLAVLPSSAFADLVTFQVTGHMTDALAPDFQVGDKFVANYTFDTTVLPELVTGTNSSFLDVDYVNVISWSFKFERGYVFSSVPSASPFTGTISLGDNKFTLNPDGLDEYIVTFGGAGASTGLPLPSGKTLSFLEVQLEDSLPAGNPDLISGLSIPVIPPLPARASVFSGGRIVYDDADIPPGIPHQPFFAVGAITVVPEPSTAILAIIGFRLLLALNVRRVGRFAEC